MEGTPRPALVGDASVLIDIADANEAVLALIAQNLARVVIPTPVLAEVDSLDERKCAALGLEVVEPTMYITPAIVAEFRRLAGEADRRRLGELQGVE